MIPHHWHLEFVDEGFERRTGPPVQAIGPFKLKLKATFESGSSHFSFKGCTQSRCQLGHHVIGCLFIQQVRDEMRVDDVAGNGHGGQGFTRRCLTHQRMSSDRRNTVTRDA